MPQWRVGGEGRVRGANKKIGRLVGRPNRVPNWGSAACEGVGGNPVTAEYVTDRLRDLWRAQRAARMQVGGPP